MQKEQSHFHSRAAYGIISDTSVLRKELSEWLVEAYYLRTFLQLSHIPLEKIISSFIILTKIRELFIVSSG
jgi:hypothetical protein